MFKGNLRKYQKILEVAKTSPAILMAACQTVAPGRYPVTERGGIACLDQAAYNRLEELLAEHDSAAMVALMDTPFSPCIRLWPGDTIVVAKERERDYLPIRRIGEPVRLWIKRDALVRITAHP